MTLKSRDEVIEDIKDIGAFFLIQVFKGLETICERSEFVKEKTNTAFEWLVDYYEGSLKAKEMEQPGQYSDKNKYF